MHLTQVVAGGAMLLCEKPTTSSSIESLRAHIPSIDGRGEREKALESRMFVTESQHIFMARSGSRLDLVGLAVVLTPHSSAARLADGHLCAGSTLAS